MSLLAIPASPIELKVDGASSTSLAISWQPPYDADGVIREYQVSYTANGGSEQFREVQDTTSTELTSLEPHTQYTIRVRAKMGNFGDFSSPITIQTPTTGKMEKHYVHYKENYLFVYDKHIQSHLLHNYVLISNTALLFTL